MKSKVPLALRLNQWFFPKLERIAPGLAQKYFIKLFLTPFRYKLPEKEIEFQKTATLFELQSSTGKIQGYSWGTEGPPVLLLHGWAGRAMQFRKLIPELTKAGFKVYAIDGPAHGKSDGKQTNILEFDAALKTFHQSIGQPFYIIAHSFGGVASLYAIMNGLPVTKLINIASPSIGDEVIKTYLNAIGASPAIGEGFKKFIKDRYNKTFDEFSALHFVKHLPNPINFLIVQDEDDQEVVLRNATELQKAYPHATLLITKGLGHTRVLKDDFVIQEAISFLKK